LGENVLTLTFSAKAIRAENPIVNASKECQNRANDAETWGEDTGVAFPVRPTSTPTVIRLTLETSSSVMVMFYRW
jgi:hypothetical protein